MLMDNTLELLGITDSNIKITRFSAESVNGEKRNVIEAREGITATGIARICHCSPSSVIRIIDEDNQGALHEPLHEPGKSCGEIRSCRPKCPVHQVHQGIVDLIVKNHPQFEKVYDAYQDVFNALKEKNRERLIDVLENYRRSGQNMDTAISTLKKNMTTVLNSVHFLTDFFDYFHYISRLTCIQKNG